MYLKKALPVVAVAALALLVFSFRSDTQVAKVSADAPYYTTLDSVAANSVAAVQGTVLRNVGKFDVPGSPLYAQDVSDFRVDNVLGQAGTSTIAVGDVIQVAMFAMSNQPSEISNLAELRAEIESYSKPLLTGSVLTLFLAPFHFSANMNGWAIVGGDYGVLQEEGPALRSLAPRGPLASAVINETDLGPILRSLGAKPAPLPSSGDAPHEPRTPATEAQ